MKRSSLLAFLLSICLILVLMVVGLSIDINEGQFCGKNVLWSYDPDTCTLTISGIGPMNDYPHSTHDSRTHPWADFDQEIRTVIVEEGVTYLGLCSFCTCTSLTEVQLPGSLLSIGENAFWNCPRLTSVTIPSQVTTIADNAFKRCDSLTHVTFLGNAPTEVSSTAFQGIASNVYYPAQNTSWDSATMIGHGGTLVYHSYEDPDRILYMTDRGPCGPEATWTLVDGILTISGSGEMAYGLWNDQKDQIRQVVVEEGITKIADNAFTRCSGLTDVRLPSTLQSIGKNAFALTPSLTQIQLPDAVTTIGAGAFAGCDALVAIQLPAQLQTIEQRAFYSCTALQELTLPDTVTRLESQAFGACTGLQNIKFLGRGPRLADVTVFDQCTATVTYPADQIYWSLLRDGLADTSLRWDPYCSGIHSENTGSVTVDPTCISPGQVECTCPVCGLVYSIETPTVDHTFEAGKCTVCGYIQPTAPTIHSCMWSGEDSIRLCWTPVEGADGYELLRATGFEPTDEDWKCAKTINDGTASAYTNHDLTPGTVYSYKIRSFNYSPTGKKLFSDFSTVIQPFGSISFTRYYSDQPDEIRLRWTPVEGAHGYQIWRLDDSGEYSIIKTIGDTGNELTDDQGNTSAYTNDQLISGESHTYIIRAFRILEDGQKLFGNFSEPVTVTVMSET